MTPADLGVLVAASAVALAIPLRERPGQPSIPTTWFESDLHLLARLIQQVGLALALVVLYRRGRYGGPVRPAERLALTLGAAGLLQSLPGPGVAMYAYFIAIGAMTMHYGSGHWSFISPMPNFEAARLVVASLATLVLLERLSVLVCLRRQTRAGSRVAAALSVVGETVAWLLFFWGPCTIVATDLAQLIDPSLRNVPTPWAPAVGTLSDAVKLAPSTLTWGVLITRAARAWVADRRVGRTWFWTEWTSLAVGGMATIHSLILVSQQGPGEGALWVAELLGAVLTSWRVSRRWEAESGQAADVIRAAPDSAE